MRNARIDDFKNDIEELATAGASAAVIAKFLWLHRKFKVTRQGVRAAIMRWRP